MEENLVFMCGALRSGSSLTHLMLDHHPDITNPGEFDFLFDQISDDGVYPDTESYTDWLSIHRIFQSKSLTINKSLAYSDLIRSFTDQLKQPDGILALNIHRGFDRIPTIFPEAKYIHLIRDPRDVARSSIGMGWAGNVYYGVEHWLQTEQAWQRLQEKISPEQYFEIRFEDLIISPETILIDLCAFIGVSYSNQMFNYANESTYSKPDPSLVRQWKTKLTVREIQYVELRAKGLMNDLDYDLSGHPTITLGLIERLWLKINNKIFKLKFSIKRYGLYLYGKEWFSRLFNLESMNRHAKVAINEVDKKYLK
jgi:Sulfotransferase family